MAPSDLEQLLEMGFEKDRAEIAVKNSGGRTHTIRQTFHLPVLISTQYKVLSNGSNLTKTSRWRRSRTLRPMPVSNHLL